MKKLHRILFLIGICLSLTGCPYESGVPIDKPSVKINKEILGTWEYSHNHGELFKVSQLDDFRYKIVKTKVNSESTDDYTAYTSIINGISFINLWESNTNETSQKYAFYKMQLESKDKIRLSEVTENIDEKFNSSEELKAFISINMKNSYFFGNNEIELVRQIR